MTVLPTHSFLSAPPLHRRHLGHPTFAYQQQTFPFEPLHTARNTRSIKHSWTAASQAAHTAQTHQPSSLHLGAFRFFQDTTIPNAQRSLCLLLHLPAALVGLLPEHLFDHRRVPPFMIEYSLEALSSRISVFCSTQEASYFAGGQLSACLHDPCDGRLQVPNHASIQLRV